MALAWAVPDVQRLGVIYILRKRFQGADAAYGGITDKNKKPSTR